MNSLNNLLTQMKCQFDLYEMENQKKFPRIDFSELNLFFNTIPPDLKDLVVTYYLHIIDVKNPICIADNILINHNIKHFSSCALSYIRSLLVSECRPETGEKGPKIDSIQLYFIFPTVMPAYKDFKDFYYQWIETAKHKVHYAMFSKADGNLEQCLSLNIQLPKEGRGSELTSSFEAIMSNRHLFNQSKDASLILPLIDFEEKNSQIRQGIRTHISNQLPSLLDNVFKMAEDLEERIIIRTRDKVKRYIENNHIVIESTLNMPLWCYILACKPLFPTDQLMNEKNSDIIFNDAKARIIEMQIKKVEI